MIAEPQTLAKVNNAVVNIFVHKSSVMLFLQDWFLKEEFMSNVRKLLAKFFPERLNQFVWWDFEMTGLLALFLIGKKKF